MSALFPSLSFLVSFPHYVRHPRSCHTFIMSYITDPAYKCGGGCTGTANPATFNPTATSSNRTEVATDQNDTVESSCKDESCSSDKPENEKKPVEDDCQNGCCSGGNVIERENAENTCKEKGCLGEDEEAPKDNCKNACCSGSVNKTNKHGSTLACCKRKSTPCCDGRNLALHPIVSYSHCL
jgi:hypothetical protein